MKLGAERFIRKYTYGQCKGLRGVVGLLRKLRVYRDIDNIEFNLMSHGSPGHPSDYIVKICYK